MSFLLEFSFLLHALPSLTIYGSGIVQQGEARLQGEHIFLGLKSPAFVDRVANLHFGTNNNREGRREGQLLSCGPTGMA